MDSSRPRAPRRWSEYLEEFLETMQVNEPAKTKNKQTKNLTERQYDSRREMTEKDNNDVKLKPISFLWFQEHGCCCYVLVA